MELISRLRRFAFHYPRIFTVEAPGGTEARLEVERWARVRGWPLAESPADTDLLVLCGRPTAELTGAIARVQAMLSRPAATLLIETSQTTSAAGSSISEERLRVDLAFDRADLRNGFAEAARRLVDDAEPVRRAVPEEIDAEEGCADDDHGGADHGHGGEGDHGGEEHEHGEELDHEEHDHEEHDHGEHDDREHDHGEHDHDDAPGGLPMASRGEDRDGLTLDVLHLSLGPVLRGWPAGLTLRLKLQGDVVQGVELAPRHLAAHRSAASWWNGPWMDALAGADVSVSQVERRRAAAHLDSLGRLLYVAGDEGGVSVAARLRDGALAGADAASLLAGVRDLERRLRRTRLLDRYTDGLGRIGQEEGSSLGLGGPALRASGCAEDLRTQCYPDFEALVALGEGDARSRWHQWLAETKQSLELVSSNHGSVIAVDGMVEGPRGVLAASPDAPAPSRALIRAICQTLEGQEFAVARLIVASFDPDIGELGSEIRR